jgi:hypothetical protein
VTALSQRIQAAVTFKENSSTARNIRSFFPS